MEFDDNNTENMIILCIEEKKQHESLQETTTEFEFSQEEHEQPKSSTEDIERETPVKTSKMSQAQR